MYEKLSENMQLGLTLLYLILGLYYLLVIISLSKIATVNYYMYKLNSVTVTEQKEIIGKLMQLETSQQVVHNVVKILQSDQKLLIPTAEIRKSLLVICGVSILSMVFSIFEGETVVYSVGSGILLSFGSIFLIGCFAGIDIAFQKLRMWRMDEADARKLYEMMEQAESEYEL